MKARLFFLLAFVGAILNYGFAQNTWYLQSIPATVIDLSNPNNWNSLPGGGVGGSVPTAANFTNDNDTWVLNGVPFTNINSSSVWQLNGNLINTGSLTNIDVNGKIIIFLGIVGASNIEISDNLSTGTVVYSDSNNTDLIPGDYNNLDLTGVHTVTAAGDISVNRILFGGSGAVLLDMNSYNISEGSSGFTATNAGSGAHIINTYSNSTSPLPIAKWPSGIKIIFNGVGVQYLPSGHYDQLDLNAGSASVNVQPGDTVKINTILNNSTNLVLEANASGYAQLQCKAAPIGGGTFTKQHYFDVSSARYFHRGTALDGAGIQNFNDGQTMTFANNNTGSVWQWNAASSNWTAPAGSGTHLATTGYAMFAGAAAGNNYMLTASGTVEVSASNIHHQDVSASMFYHDGTGSSATFADAVIDGWNFVANPFLGNYDFENHDLSSSGAGTMGNYYYVLNGSNYEFYQQGGINNGGTGGGTGSFGASPYLAPGQGVWFRTPAGWSGNISFDSANVNMSGSASMYQTTLPSDIIKLNVAEVGGSYSDQVIIRLDANATDNEDFSLDVPKKSNPGNVPNTFVELGNGTWALCAANPSRKSFPLHFRDIDHGQQMEYSIWENTLATYGRVFIEDKKNNTFTELTSSNYTFTNDTAYGEDRFVIHFESGVGLPEGMIPEATAYDAFYSNETIQITFQEESFRPTTGSLYNLQGKLVSSFEINDANTTISIPNVSTGIYLLAIDGDTAGARKLYINK